MAKKHGKNFPKKAHTSLSRKVVLLRHFAPKSARMPGNFLCSALFLGVNQSLIRRHTPPPPIPPFWQGSRDPPFGEGGPVLGGGGPALGEGGSLLLGWGSFFGRGVLFGRGGPDPKIPKNLKNVQKSLQTALYSD
jgi:hypothetical protein